MAAVELVDFQDIYTAVSEAIQVATTNTADLNKIKRFINIVYLNKVVPHKRWWWLRNHTDLNILVEITAGTVSVVQDSASANLSSTIASSVTGYYFLADGDDEIYEISAHTAGTAALTLGANYIEATDATSSYALWKYKYALPANAKEVISVYRDDRIEPLEAVGIRDFRARVAQNPKKEGPPEIYTTTDFDSSGNREIWIYPAKDDERHLLHVDYIQEADALDADADLPLMPVEDRSILYLGALEMAWRNIQRNTEEANNSKALFDEKLAKMAGDTQDSVDLPQLSPSRVYLSRKRMNQRFRGMKNKAFFWRRD